MFFATAAHPQARRQAPYSAAINAGASLERFMGEALRANRNPSATFTQDDTSFALSLDVPGIAKEQLGIAIDGAVVRITSKEDAPRSFRAAYELPQDIDATQSQARLENGVLTLKLAKRVPVNSATELAIQ